MEKTQFLRQNYRLESDGMIKTLNQNFFVRSTKKFQNKLVIENKLSLSDWRGKPMCCSESPKVSRWVGELMAERTDIVKNIFLDPVLEVLKIYFN